MIEAALVQKTPDLAPRPMLRLLPALESHTVASDARYSVRNTVEAATSYTGLAWKAAVGQGDANFKLALSLKDNLSITDPAQRAAQERALGGLTHTTSGKDVAAIYENFARASTPSPQAATAITPNYKGGNTLDAFLNQEKSTPAKRLQVVSASRISTQDGPRAFGKTVKSGFSSTLAYGSPRTFAKSTNTQAALRGPVASRAFVPDSVTILAAARRNGPSFKPAVPTPVFALAPSFTLGSRPTHYGRTMSMSPR